jgi:alpha-1,3-mannosyltransferase
MSTMKVLAVTPTFFPQMGGLEQVVLELALRVRDYGIRMDVAHVASGIKSLTESVEGVEVHRVPLRGNRLIGWAPGLGALARRYDLLHVHDPQLLAITMNVRLTCGRIPAVLSTHGGFWHTTRGYVVKRIYEATLLRGSVRHYRRVLASSVSDFEYFKRYSARIDLCSNGVHVKEYNTVKSQGSNGLTRWIYWGRLSRNKRVDLVIDYLAVMRRRGHPAELLICGKDFDGLMPQLRAQVARLGLEDAVRFQPFLDNVALLAELTQRSIFITASEHEGFGLTVVEAMAAGLIVVCRDMAPLNSFFTQGKSGWSLQFDGTERDFQSLHEMLSKTPGEVDAMSAGAREAASAYDWAAAVPRFARHYHQVLSRESLDGLGDPGKRHAE